MSGTEITAEESKASSWSDIFGEYDEFLAGPRSGTFRKCKTCGGMHALQAWPHNCMTWEPDNRSELNVSTMVISDSLESLGGVNGIQSQADGRWHTSKSRLRADYRALGMVEMGNSKAEPRNKPRPDRRQIKETVAKALNAVEYGARTENFVRQRKAKPAGGTFA